MPKIVITGMGAVTPVGIGLDAYWKNITSGKSGIERIKSFDTGELAVQIAGEIKDFSPGDYMPKDLIRKTDPFMALVAAMCIEDKIIERRNRPRRRFDVATY